MLIQLKNLKQRPYYYGKVGREGWTEPPPRRLLECNVACKNQWSSTRQRMYKGGSSAKRTIIRLPTWSTHTNAGSYPLGRVIWLSRGSRAPISRLYTRGIMLCLLEPALIFYHSFPALPPLLVVPLYTVSKPSADGRRDKKRDSGLIFSLQRTLPRNFFVHAQLNWEWKKWEN